MLSDHQMQVTCQEWCHPALEAQEIPPDSPVRQNEVEHSQTYNQTISLRAQSPVFQQHQHIHTRHSNDDLNSLLRIYL